MSTRSHRVTVRHKVWLETAGAFALGDGGIELLRAVDGAGSLRGAAAQITAGTPERTRRGTPRDRPA